MRKNCNDALLNTRRRRNPEIRRSAQLALDSFRDISGRRASALGSGPALESTAGKRGLRLARASMRWRSIVVVMGGVMKGRDEGSCKGDDGGSL